MYQRLLMIPIIFALAGCGEVNRKYGGQENDDFSPSVSPQPIPLFPHPSDWQSSHRLWVRQNGFEDCFACHTRETPTSPEAPPTCSSCHFLYPHESDWVANHGAHVMEEGKSECATSCHGTDLKGGSTGISCNSCHAIYPHPSGWKEGDQHGAVALNEGNQLCRGSCHGNDFAGGTSGVACSSCHTFPYPHVAGWAAESGQNQLHADYVNEHTNSSCARVGCHGTNLVPTAGVTKGPACTSCHTSVYPHVEGWSRGEVHGESAQENLELCKGCHGQNLDRAPPGFRVCRDCHESYPHPEMAVWRMFEGHGRKAKEEGLDECRSCHGNDLRELKNGRNCYSCHTTFPHETGWRAEIGQLQPHGAFVLENSAESCEGCHPLQAGGEPRRNPSCTTCHNFPYPHPANWAQTPGQPQPHGDFVNLNSSSSCARGACHGAGLVPGPTSRGPSCNTAGCHGPVYPHSAEIAQGLVHGPPALLDIAVCKACHGDNLDGAPAGFRNCRNCHPSIVEHDFAEIGADDWVARHDDVARNPPYNRNVEECRLCHGHLLEGGISGRSCFACHEHLDGWPSGWVGEGREAEHAINFIGQILGTGSSTCATCHGAEYDQPVGADGIRCTTCHTEGVTHRTVGGVDWNTLGGHGTYFSSNFTAGDSEARCWDCHGMPISFQETQTKDYLATQSQCYGCHYSYPHSGWTMGGSELPWEPVITNTCGPRSVSNFAHFLYILDSPLLTNEAGDRPDTGSTPVGDPLWGDAIEHTCGGEAGSCHFEGNRTFRTDNGITLCSSYCHNPTRPWPTELRDCSSPPEALVRDAAPSVVSTTPADEAVDVVVIGGSSSFRTIVLANFSEPMDRTTVTTAGTFILRKVSDGSIVDGRVTCSSPPNPGWCQRATFTPTNALALDTLYEAVISTGARDWGGTPLSEVYSWQFRTAPPDVVPPSVVSTAPAGGAANVPVTTRSFTATFNEPLRSSSVSERNNSSYGLCNSGWARFCVRRTVLLVCPAGRPACNSIAGSIACSGADCSAVRFTMNAGLANLSYSTGYTLTLKEYRDLTGNVMAAPFTWTFTTEEEPFDEDW